MYNCLLLTVVCVLLWTPCLAAEENLVPAPIYALPDPGAWVEYQWVQVEGNRRTEGLLQIYSAGCVEQSGLRCREVHIKRTIHDGNQDRWWERKLLIAESSTPWRLHVAQCWQRVGHNPFVQLSSEKTRQFLSMGFDTTNVLLKAGGTQPLTTSVGTLETKLFRTQGTMRGVPVEFRVWLTEQIPSGWAKMEIRQGSERGTPMLFQAIIARTGKELVQQSR